MSLPDLEYQASRLSNHGAELLKQGLVATSVACLQRACSYGEDPRWQTNLALALTSAGEWDDAEQLLVKLIRQFPRFVEAYHALGNLCLNQERWLEAAGYFSSCSQLDPENSLYKFSFATACLGSGNWELGWRYYEHRKDIQPRRVFEYLKPWTGEAGQKIYVWAEQGLGDVIQFARFLPQLAKRSQQVVFSVPVSLRGLLSGYDEVVQVVSDEEQIPAGLTHEVMLMSLPLYLDTTLNSIPPEPGYLEKLLATQGAKPKSDGNFRVGLCWAGAPGHYYARERQVPLAELLTLTSLPARFFSLQVGSAVSDISLNRAQVLIQDMSPLIEGDWVKTGLLLRELDLVVTADTALAHLAGALGIPTFMLLSYVGEWRWADRKDDCSIWYPSLRVFRQFRPYAWKPVVQEVFTALEDALAEFKLREFP